MTSPRLTPPFWRHDAYTLGRLAAAVQGVAERHVVPSNGHAPPCVVDFGAGEAPYRSLFESRGARYLACDLEGPTPNDVCIEPGQPLPLADGCAELVLSFQVLEHVWNLDWYLGEATRLLAPDGHLVLSTHGTWLYHPHPTDFRRWTRAGLVAELKMRGLHAVSVTPLVGPLAWTTQFRAIAWDRLLQRLPLIGNMLAATSNVLHHLRMRLEDAITPQELIENNAAIYLVLAQRGRPSEEDQRVCVNS